MIPTNKESEDLTAATLAPTTLASWRQTPAAALGNQQKAETGGACGVVG